MLARLKTASPKWRLLIGAWIAVEVLSLPAAAGMAFSLTQSEARPLIVETINTGVPGMSQYLVTHHTDFDVVVSDLTNDVSVKVEDAHTEFTVMTNCARLISTEPRTVKTVQASSNPDKPIGTVFVTLIHKADEVPLVKFDPTSTAPPALPCPAH